MHYLEVILNYVEIKIINYIKSISHILIIRSFCVLVGESFSDR
jgi:hypothetical protein